MNRTCPPRTNDKGQNSHLQPKQAPSQGFDAPSRSPPNTRSRPCAPGLCLTHTTGPPGSFPGETEPSTTSHTERVHRLRKSPSENVCGQQTASPRSADGVLDSCAQHRRGPRRQAPTAALPVPSTCLSSPPGLPGSATPEGLSRVQSISLCFRTVLYIVFSFLGNTRFKSKEP